jgi:CheY-like chemotaxis protein
MERRAGYLTNENKGLSHPWAEAGWRDSTPHFDHASGIAAIPIVRPQDGGERVKLAIVEDEVILAMALTLMLEDWGHQIVGSADTEASALALVAAERPDVVLMDIRLGRTDSGLRVACLIRASSDLPIVFCTAYADNAQVQAEVRGIGNAHLIGKPVDEDQLERLLRRLEEQRRKAEAPFAPRHADTLQSASNDA